MCEQRRQRAGSDKVRRSASSEAVRSINWSVGSTVRDSLGGGRCARAPTARVSGTKHAVPATEWRGLWYPPTFASAPAPPPADGLRARTAVAATPSLTIVWPSAACGRESSAARHAAACCFAMLALPVRFLAWTFVMLSLSSFCFFGSPIEEMSSHNDSSSYYSVTPLLRYSLFLAPKRAVLAVW